MNRLSPLFVALLAAIYMSVTGFQCGSAEVTSAKLYMQQRQYDKAEESLIRQVAKDPQDEEAWFMLGQVRVELMKYLEANDAYDRALALSDIHKKEIQNNKLAFWGKMLNEGIEAFRRGTSTPASYDTAITKFETAIRFQPDSVYTYFALSLAQSAKNEDDKAMANLELALRKRPDFPEAVLRLGSIHLFNAQGRRAVKDEAGMKVHLNKAAAVYETALAARPGKVEYISQLIDIYNNLGQEEKALAITRDALQNDPGNRTFVYVYGEFLLKQNKYEESIAQLRTLVEPKPDTVDLIYTNAVYNLGVAYQNWGVAMRQEAEKRAEAEAKSGRKGKEVKEDLSYREKLRLALPYFERSAELKKDDPFIWQQLAKLYATLNMSDQAKEAFKKFDELNK